MSLLIDQINKEQKLKVKKTIEQKKSEAVTGSIYEKVSDDEWKAYIKKKAAENLRKAGAALAEKRAS